MKPFTIQAWHSPEEVKALLKDAGYQIYDQIDPDNFNTAIRLIYKTGLNIMLFHTQSEKDVLWVDKYKFGQR